MGNTPTLMDYLKELLQRLKTKKPKFFVVLQIITGVLGAITGLPAFLAQFSIILPPAALVLENKYVAWASIGFMIASQLTTSSPAATVTKDGVVLTKTDEKKLPFTEKVEVKKAQDDMVANSTRTLEEVKK